MDLTSPWFLVLFVLLMVVGAFVWLKWLKMFNSPDGERYRKMRAQGPFVPLPPDEEKSEK